ncbi:hypothetical protein ACFLY0_00315 [Patescibacteria group bacterium]
MNIKNITKILFFTTIFAMCIFPAVPNAQAANTDVILDSIPRIPGPNDDVSLKLTSYSVDLSRSKISWYEDGELVLSGTGKTEYSFVMKDLGSRTKFNIYVQQGGLKQIEISRTFVSSEVDLLWEATQSYTPPFYKGKALPASQEEIRIVAMPNVTSVDGVKLNPNNLIYKWRKNGKYRDLNSQSGYNRKSVVFEQDLLNAKEDVSVEISSSTWDASANGRVVIERVQPEIYVYHNHPLEGIIYEKILDKNFLMENKEVSVAAEPYYFSLGEAGFDNISFNWRTDNKPVVGDELGSNMIFGFEKDSIGSSSISLEIKHLRNILQSARTSFGLKYGETESFFNTLF